MVKIRNASPPGSGSPNRSPPHFVMTLELDPQARGAEAGHEVHDILHVVLVLLAAGVPQYVAVVVEAAQHHLARVLLLEEPDDLLAQGQHELARLVFGGQPVELVLHIPDGLFYGLVMLQLRHTPLLTPQFKPRAAIAQQSRGWPPGTPRSSWGEPVRQNRGARGCRDPA